MIDLCRDCLLLIQENGEAVPCSAEDLTFEIVGSSKISHEVLRHCAAGILHYFKSDLGRSRITVSEFSEALVRVLAGFGYDTEVSGMDQAVAAALDPARGGSGPAKPSVHLVDLQHLALEAGKMGELGFFLRLKSELAQGLSQASCTVDCHGLRPAVKQLLGRKQWSPACRELEQRIVDTLRQWYRSRSPSRTASLVVR